MVSAFERQICFGGLISLYSYMGYKFFKTKFSFNKKYHETLMQQANKFEEGAPNNNLKIIHTQNEKILFLFGVENNKNAFLNDNLNLVEKIFENFSPNYLILERDLKFSSGALNNKKELILKLYRDNIFKKYFPDGGKNISNENSEIDMGYIFKNLDKIAEGDRINFFADLENISNYNISKENLNFISLKDVHFDMFNLWTDFKRNALLGNKCVSLTAGIDYLRLKSMIRKKLNLMQITNLVDKNNQKREDDRNNIKEKDYSSLKDVSKMSIKERVQYKEHQLDMNSKFNIYEDIKEYINSEIKNELEILNLKNKDRKGVGMDMDGVMSLEHKENREELSSISSNFNLSKIEADIDNIFNSVVIEEMNDIIINNILDNKKLYVGLVIIRKERLNNLYEKLQEYNKTLL